MADPRATPTVHASAVLIDGRGILLRGASGAGKSILALDLLAEAARRGLDAALVADDRTVLQPAHGRLIARAEPTLAGRAELRGLGIVALPHEPAAVISLVVDVVWEQPPRLPDTVDETILVEGILLPHVVLWSQDRAPILKLWHAVARLAPA